MIKTEPRTIKRSSERSWALALDSPISARLALLVFVVIGMAVVVAVPVVARHQWFWLDDWSFLVYRTAGNPHQLLIPHGAHWSTLPILLYRALFNIFGLHTYLPYQLPVDILHFVAAVLLRVIMRRAGVGPWIATAAACLFALFGSGYEDIIWGFQVGYVGALVLGLTHLILTDREDRRIDSRDWLGLLAGATGLLCASGVAIVMIAVVGLAALGRRGWRIALFHAGPPALIYGVWWFFIGRHYSQSWSSSTLAHVDLVFRWVKDEVGGAFEAMGHFAGVGVVLAIVLVLGLVLAWRSRDRSERRRLTATGALLGGSMLFVVVTAWARETPGLVSYASNPHYFDMIAALMLPAIAVSADAIGRRWRILLPAMLALLLVGVPGNLYKLANPGGGTQPAFQIALRHQLLAAAAVPLAHELPSSYRPDPYFAPQVTVGWLLAQKAAGRVPNPGPLGAQEEADLTVGALLKQSTGSPGAKTCSALSKPMTRRLSKGESIWISGGDLEVRYVTRQAQSTPLTFYPVAGEKLTALVGPITMSFGSSSPSEPAELCT